MNADEMADRSRGSTVTPGVLTDSTEGGLLASGYDPLVAYLGDDEQPHYVFEVGRVFSGVWDDDLDHGSHIRVVVTDWYIRTVSETLDLVLYYDSLDGVGSLVKGNRCILILHGDGYNVTYLVSSPNETDVVEELRDAVEYIRGRRSPASR